MTLTLLFASTSNQNSQNSSTATTPGSPLVGPIQQVGQYQTNTGPNQYYGAAVGVCLGAAVVGALNLTLLPVTFTLLDFK